MVSGRPLWAGPLNHVVGRACGTVRRHRWQFNPPETWVIFALLSCHSYCAADGDSNGNTATRPTQRHDDTRTSGYVMTPPSLAQRPRSAAGAAVRW